MQTGLWSIAWFTLQGAAHQAEEFLPRDRIVAEAAQHGAGHEVGTSFVDPAHDHAVMRGLDQHAYALRPEHFVEVVAICAVILSWICRRLA